MHCVDGILEGVGLRAGPFEYVGVVGEVVGEVGVIGQNVLVLW